MARGDNPRDILFKILFRTQEKRLSAIQSLQTLECTDQDYASPLTSTVLQSNCNVRKIVSTHMPASNHTLNAYPVNLY